MKVTQVSYGKTISLGEGSYESVRIDLSAQVESGEKYEDVLEKLRKDLLKQEKLAKKQGF